MIAPLLLFGIVVVCIGVFAKRPQSETEYQTQLRTAYAGAYSCIQGGDCPGRYLCLSKDGSWDVAGWDSSSMPEWTVGTVKTKDSVERTAIFLPVEATGRFGEKATDWWAYAPRGERLVSVESNSLVAEDAYVLQSRRITAAWSTRCRKP